MDYPDKIWPLMARALNGEASEREQEELLEILRQDEQLQHQYDLLTRIWKEKEVHPDNEDNNDAARSTISRIISKAATAGTEEMEPPARSTRSRGKKVWLIAASVAVLLSAGWILKNGQFFKKEGTKQNALEALKGSRSKSLLPDGTTVWLNVDSKLFYENDFTGATREVRLEGEAFFDVAKLPDQPFIVHTSGIDIKVLGTAFNVKSYPEDKMVETTLYRGLVTVFREENPRETTIQLKPNQKLILAKQAANNASDLSEDVRPTRAKAIPPSFTIAHIDSTKKENERIETAWLYGRLEFRSNSFEELARKLERWYNIEIVFTDEKVKQLSFDGTFENETTVQAFEALKVANNHFKYKINNHEIIVGSVD